MPERATQNTSTIITKERVSLLWAVLMAICAGFFWLVVERWLSSYDRQIEIQNETLRQVAQIKQQLDIADFNSMRGDIDRHEFEAKTFRRELEILDNRVSKLELNR